MMNAFVVGYTGGIGNPLSEQIIKHGLFNSLALVGRRKTDLFKSTDKTSVEEKVVNFDQLTPEPFTGCQVGFCVLGTTRGKVQNQDEYIKIDRDYVLSVATQAKASGCHHLLVVTSQGANKDSRVFYLRLKGEIEEGLKGVGLPRLSIFRPAFLLSRTTEFRLSEKVLSLAMKPVNLMTNKFSVPVVTCSQGLVAAATITPLPGGREGEAVAVYENSDIHLLARLFNEKHNV